MKSKAKEKEKLFFKYQIGVMGSAADTKYSKKVEKIAEEVGNLLARKGHVIFYGAEKDSDSLSTAAARGAKNAGGLTVGVTYENGKKIWDKDGNTDIVIASGLGRGGGREYVLVNSCDGIIAVSGGSGTLNEIAVAYQLNIPIVVIKGTGGWSDKLAGDYLDSRKRMKIVSASNPEDATKKLLAILEKRSLDA